MRNYCILECTRRKLSGDNLVFDNVHYIYAASNSSFRPIKVGKIKGRATENGENTGEFIFPTWVNEIKGQSNQEWVWVSGLMWDAMFRNKDIPNYDLRDVTIDNITLMSLDDKTSSKQTNDSELISILKSSLAGKEIQTNQIPKYELRVFSEKFKGLYYYLDVIIDNDLVYLGNRGKFYKAESKLSSWIQKS